MALGAPTFPIVIPEPRLITLVEGLKCVFCPVMTTGTLNWPWIPLLGDMEIKLGPAVTVNPFASVTTSAPVVTVRLVAPSDAVPVIDTGTVMLVAIAPVCGAPAVTAVLLNVTTDAVEKCVALPVIVTANAVALC